MRWAVGLGGITSVPTGQGTSRAVPKNPESCEVSMVHGEQLVIKGRRGLWGRGGHPESNGMCSLAG